MRKITYYTTLIALWVAVVLFLSTIGLCCGLRTQKGGFKDAVAIMKAGQPVSEYATDGERIAYEYLRKAVYEKRKAEELYGTNDSWQYRLGTIAGSIQLWIISLGLVLFLRSFVYKLIFKEPKSYPKTTASILVILGVVWFSMNVGAGLLKNHAEEELIKGYNGYHYE